MFTVVPNAVVFIQVDSLRRERYCVKKAELVLKTVDKHITKKSVCSWTKFTFTDSRVQETLFVKLRPSDFECVKYINEREQTSVAHGVIGRWLWCVYICIYTWNDCHIFTVFCPRKSRFLYQFSNIYIRRSVILRTRRKWQELDACLCLFFRNFCSSSWLSVIVW
jgi:hypothetical protein